MAQVHKLCNIIQQYEKIIGQKRFKNVKKKKKKIKSKFTYLVRKNVLPQFTL